MGRDGAGVMAPPSGRHRQRSALFGREFVSLTGAQLLSLVGDQIARVALSVLVYHRTHSPLWTAVSYLLTFVPVLIGGPLLAGVIDRVPRKRVLVIADIYRAVLVACAAVPHLPLALLVVLLGMASLAEGPFDAALSALLPDLLKGEESYVRGLAVRRTVIQGSQVLGFALGGLALTGLSPRLVLLVDAGTFVVSAGCLGRGLSPRHAPDHRDDDVIDLRGRGRAWRDLRVAWRAIGDVPGLLGLVVIIWIVALIGIVPEGIAAPYARHLHAGSGAVGLLLAAGPAGSVLGTVVVARCSTRARDRGFAPLALLVTLAPVLLWLDPPLPVALLALVVSGFGAACNLPAQTTFVAAIPAHQRGRAFTVVGTGMSVGQGVGIAAGGGLALWLGAPHAIALSASVGSVVVAVLLAARSRSARFRSALVAGHTVDSPKELRELA